MQIQLVSGEYQIMKILNLSAAKKKKIHFSIKLTKNDFHCLDFQFDTCNWLMKGSIINDIDYHMEIVSYCEFRSCVTTKIVWVVSNHYQFAFITIIIHLNTHVPFSTLRLHLWHIFPWDMFWVLQKLTVQILTNYVVHPKPKSFENIRLSTPFLQFIIKLLGCINIVWSIGNWFF